MPEVSEPEAYQSMVPVIGRKNINELEASGNFTQAGDPFHVHRPRIHGVEMDGPCIHFHPFNGAGRYIIHPSTPGFHGMDRWKWKQGDGHI
ncbi:hypothetical protein FPOAC2_13814 [Fusarium poae]